jgi:hypothetical protein
VHAPLQPAKTEFPEGTAVSKTAVPVGSRAEQEVTAFVQLIPPELLVTDPLPFPVTITSSVWPGTKFAVTDSSAFMTTEQVEIPEQLPLQPVKAEPKMYGVAMSVTVVPLAKLAEQEVPH